MKGKFKLHGVLGIVVFALATIMMRHGQEPFATYFYCFAWWSYIFIADALVYWIQGESLLLNNPRRFLLMIPCSIFIWCIFEGFNFRLKNWHYINVPRQDWMRWVGYAAAYATVLPGLCETSQLLRGLGFLRPVSWKRANPSPSILRALTFLGATCLLATILFPRYCFPLVWLGFALLLDPLNNRYGGNSLLRDIENGEVKWILTLLAAGLFCGFLWEFWNFWAQTKWIYTVPFFEEGKLFEMPMLGFLGFPPFTLSAYVIYRFILLLRQRGVVWVRGILWSSLLLCCLLIFAGIDRFTVVSYIPLIKDLPGFQEEWKQRLQGAGMEKVQDLLRRGTEDLLDLGFSPRDAEGLLRTASLITLKGIGMENYRLLRSVGVKDIYQLAQQDPSDLYLTLRDMNRRQHISHRHFTPAVVRLWVQEAKRRAK